jgi:hypothetical protein
MEKRPGATHGLDEWIRHEIGEKDPKKLKRLSFAISHSLQMKGIRAQPYMAPAAEKGRSQLTDLVKIGVARAVKEIFG